jgi:hypothetical protein
VTTKHTRSPWSIHEVADKLFIGPPRIDGSGLDCVVTSFDVHQVVDRRAEQMRADARLISAAPELLAACEASLAWPVSDNPQDGCIEAEAMLHAAIAKARGGT